MGTLFAASIAVTRARVNPLLFLGPGFSFRSVTYFCGMNLRYGMVKEYAASSTSPVYRVFPSARGTESVVGRVLR